MNLFNIKKNILREIFFLIFPFLFFLCLDSGQNSGLSIYSYTIINTYPHDPGAFTQGLVFSEGSLYEGTGIRGESRLRRVDIESGDIQQEYALPDEYFGEGITVFDDKIIQLTWTSGTGFVYDLQTFTVIDQFSYDHEGWGLTYNESHLIVSDGTSRLRFLDPATFSEKRSITARRAGEELDMLNELEYMNGRIYANVWLTDEIAIIDPDTGEVTGIADLSGLRDICIEENGTTVNVLNGIAYDPQRDRLFITGKLWPFLFEIKLKKE